MSEINKALADQIIYYQLRANEYDEWWYRQGRYDRGAVANGKWFKEADQVKTALDRFELQGHILELAPGTGIWTQKLIDKAITVTAVDASGEMITINQVKVNSDKVSYVLANLFEWEPTQTYDAVFFSFWISHVPREKLADFLSLVSHSLRPAGKVFFLDGLREESSTAVDHQLPYEKSQVMTRILNDRQSFDIVKVFYQAGELVEAGKQAGLAIHIDQTPTYFYFGSGYKL
jgi:2-polyprenyl-3-methyl-5-hydroxy-6-metoxy-1,4-benzoquinol methylase